MKPIKLTINAFGPFAGEQVIDFRKLGDRSFFLIHGPTGAGKTTILDAVCFALFGESSGAERKAEDLRSDYTNSSMPTEVTLDFVLGSSVYRIRRRPAHERPSKRGEGTTLEKRNAILWNRTGILDDAIEGKIIAQTWDEVRDNVKQLLGFDSAQFRQVIMLPQDKFQKLFKANSSEREDLFKVLFNTHVYEKMEDALNKEEDSLSKRIDQLQRDRTNLLASSQIQSEEKLDEQIQNLKNSLAEIGLQIDCLRSQVSEAESQFRAGEEIQRLISEKEKAESALLKLESQKRQYEDKKVILDKARRASILSSQENELSRQQQDALQAEDDCTKTEKEYRIAVVTANQAIEALEAEEQKDDVRQSAASELKHLQSLHEKVKELDSLRTAFHTANETARVAKEKYLSAERVVKSTNDKIKDLEVHQQREQFIAAQLTALQLAEENLKRSLNSKEQSEGIANQIRVATKNKEKIDLDFRQAEEHFSQAQRKFDSISTAWNEGQAAILAKQLRDNSPCPVCGSIHHPNPATSSRDLPTQQEVKRLEMLVDQLRRKREELLDSRNKVEQEISGLARERTTIAQVLGSTMNISLKQLEAELGSTSRKRTEAEESEAATARIKNELQGLRIRQASAEDQFKRVEQDLREADNQVVSARTRFEERSRDVPDKYQDMAILIQDGKDAKAKFDLLQKSLEDARLKEKQASERVAAIQARHETQRQYANTSKQRANQLREQFAQKIQAAGFVIEEDYRLGKKYVSHTDSLQNEINDYEVALGAARTEVERARAKAQNLTMPDMSSLRSTLEKAKARLEETLREEGQKNQEMGQKMKLSSALKQKNEELEEQDKRYKIVGGLAKIAKGDNNIRISFHRYVLKALLENVLTFASKRLQMISKGKYYLHSVTDSTDRRRALELEVNDADTGQSRSVDTLSGGESFYTSLSLALGLADIAGGGRHLD